MIFGQKLAVFIFFDKEKKVRFLSELFYPVLWLAAHWVKWFSGASEQIEGVKKNRQDSCTCFYHTNTPFCTLCQQFHFEKVEKKGGHAASYIAALFMTLDRRIVRARQCFGAKYCYKVKNLVEPKRTVRTVRLSSIDTPVAD